MRGGPGQAYGVRPKYERLVGRRVSTLKRVAVFALAGVAPVAAGAQRQIFASTSLVLDGVAVVDVEQGRVVPHQRVVIAGNRIQAAGDVGGVPLPHGARVVKAVGKYLIPGLWDMHTHPGPYADLFYPLYLANGVTGIRDASSNVALATLRQWRQDIVAGARIGPPRQLLSGKAIDGNGISRGCKRWPADSATFMASFARERDWHSRTFMTRLADARKGDSTYKALDLHLDDMEELAGLYIGQAFHICVADTADAEHLVDSLKAAGADMLKMYDLSRSMYFVIAAAARHQGLPFGGHLNRSEVTFREASDSGASIFDHDSPLRAAVAPCLEPDADLTPCRTLAEQLRRHGTWFVPTWSHLGPEQWYPRTSHEPIYTRLRQHLHRYFPTFWLQPLPTAEQLAENIQAYAGNAGVLRRAEAAGFPLLAGTDVAPSQRRAPPGGFALQVELTALVASGLTPLAALQSATLNPAKMLHGTDSLGMVAPGKLADLVLLDGDPLADITNTARIRAVVANGRYFDRVALDQILAATGAVYARDTDGGRHPLELPRP